MALFEFEDGRLIPAQFGRPVATGLTAELVDAICGQVLEIVSRPLFPITWRDLARVPVDQDSPRLTALDATGQVVSVEVVARLDSDTLIASLSRLADAAALSWTDLAREYEGGVDAFKNGWLAFRDSMPPAPGAGPRLVMVVGSIDPQVRPALDVLATSGVEVHEVSLRRMSNGRTFLEVLAVGPRLYGHAPQLLLGQSGSVAELPAARSEARGAGAREPQNAEAEPVPVEAREPEAAALPGSEAGAGLETAPADDGSPEAEVGIEPEAVPKPGAEPVPAEEPAASSPAPAESPEIVAAREAGVPVLGRDADALKVLASLIGERVPLVAHSDCGAPLGLVLGADGIIRSDVGEWETPTELEAIAPALADAWDHLRLADLSGPSLSESVDEVNRDMIREYSQAPERRAGRHGAD